MWSAVKSSGSAPAPCSRGKHSATLLGGQVYVLGGRGAGGALPLKDFWRYSLADGKWERLPCRGEPPPALQEHTAVARGARLYVFGGEAGALSTETPLWIYNTETEIWRKLSGNGAAPARGARRAARGAGGGAAPRGRRGHSAHALSDCMLVYGGYKDLRGSTNELWAFHYETESWHQVRTATAGPPRHRHAAALHDTKLYVHAGMHDLRECADLWQYDTLSRVWAAVRGAGAGAAPGARSGHAALRAGAHLYVFGGDARGRLDGELWRFHFATETWDRIHGGHEWPSARVDACALLVPEPPARPAGSAPAPAARRAEPPAGLLREISRLNFNIRRSNRCSYTVLAADPDSTESLVRPEPAAPMSKSHSAYVIDARPDGRGPREADEAEYRCDVSREPISVPDFADMILPTPVLSPVEASKLVYLDSDEEEDARREAEARAGRARRVDVAPARGRVALVPKSASVRFTAETAAEDESEMSTSDYASAERVNGPPAGFCNPHYLGPDVRRLGSALTPDSGVGPGDIELRDLGERAPARPGAGPRLHLLLVGGREVPHAALLQRPLSMWTYRLL